MYIHVAILLLVFGIGPVSAQNVFEHRNTSVFNSGVIETSVVVEAEYYQFTEVEQEKLRYLRVIDSPFSVANISGLELLGKYAESAEERDEYARRYLAAQSDNVIRSNVWALTVQRVGRETDLTKAAIASSPDLVRELADVGFSITEGDVSKRLYEKKKAENGFDLYEKFGRSSKVVNFFVSLECGNECDKEFKSLHSDTISGAIGELNVVFIGAGESEKTEVFDWARSNSITKHELTVGYVNLHLDSKEWEVLRVGNDVPQIH